MWEEFKKFALKGNVLDLAIGVIIGAAFGNIVSSLVEDIVMPLFGFILGGVDFTTLEVPVGDAALKYGVFIQSVIDFLIIAFSIFLAIKGLNKFKQKKEEKEESPPEPSQEEKLLTEIRDLLKKQQSS
ncbi:mechanosensitive ion channel protein MscL [Ammoniphilus oxalaticus]|uniref:Large-conductance mechanosensitive channel n=1 Tax=Ammoniphilus oxalaticus TaxID=66863 RepID=A0A419SKJ1_9BACL|nr:large conductance mechanosensitive channel protein MscL [Ammoniphilus oxalaticus]RKD24517.1 mechanosensitive ion channel protein MscL [Ammoniphilus oxalaticus]